MWLAVVDVQTDSLVEIKVIRVAAYRPLAPAASFSQPLLIQAVATMIFLKMRCQSQLSAVVAAQTFYQMREASTEVRTMK